MKLLSFTCAVLSASFLSLHAQTTVVLIEENYEGATRVLNTGNAGGSTTEVPDPAVGGTNGTVAAFDLSGANEWGAVNAIPTNLPLPVATEAGLDTVFATIDIYIDSANTTFNVGEAEDRFNLIFRFNRGTDDNKRVNITTANAWESLPLDQWATVTIPLQTIPAVDVDGTPITHVMPIISFRDQGTALGGVEALPGIAAYFDNFRIDVTARADDPNLGASPLGFGDLVQSTGPHTQSLTILNTGSSNDLTISAASIDGVSAAQFSVDSAIFPLTVAPDSSEVIEVTFAPGTAIGSFAANLNLTSNDVADPVVAVALSAEVEPPFQGVEMIINGDFESGDLTGWRDDDRFDYTEIQANSGTGAAVFTMTGSQQWGESRQLRPGGQDNETALEITPDMIGKAYEYSAWYFRPSTGGPDPLDTIMTIFRWNAINVGNHTYGRMDVGDLPVDTWIRVTGEGVIPDVDSDGVAVDHVVILWSFQDVDRDDVAGKIMYLDDVSFKIEGSPPAPDLEFTSIVVDEGADVVRLTWTSAPGTVYSIDRASVLNGIWLEEVEEFPAGAGEETTWEDTAALGLGEDRLFYRVRVLTPAP